MIDTQAEFNRTMANLRNTPISDWDDIAVQLESTARKNSPVEKLHRDEFLTRVANGLAFVTFEYGVDGVSIEIAKYAKSLELLLSSYEDVNIHLIGEAFHPQSAVLFKSRWRRVRIEGINGWKKWEGGKWFSALFYEDMPDGSQTSTALAAEIFKQAVNIAGNLGNYILTNDIFLLLPINVMSNPGNPAFSIALALVSKVLDLYIINSNHDFYWEGGKTAAERASEDPPGSRDHFYRNADNQAFFQLFESLYPWNGRRWVQANINSLQSSRLVNQFGIPEEKVYELPTSVGEGFFETYTQADVKSARLRMSYILSGGEATLQTVSLDEHLKNLGSWMGNQAPIVMGAEKNLRVDLTANSLIYLLQPTRIIARKRIEKDVALVAALLEQGPLRVEFDANHDRQLVLHITGPAPIEHQTDLEIILRAFIQLLENLPASIAKRVFLAFSVGTENHPALKANNLKPLSIKDIYRLATVVLFPSETEGRGLPIIEASAAGVPIICSRYQPEQVFAEVVGEELPEDQQILYTLFPEGDFDSSFLDEVAGILLYPDKSQPRRIHNQKAVRMRYSTDALKTKFELLLDRLRTLP